METKGRLYLWISTIHECLDTIKFFERCSEAEGYQNIVDESTAFFEKPETARKGIKRPFPTLTELHFLKYKLIDLLSVEFWRLYSTGYSLPGMVAGNIKNPDIETIRKEMEQYAERKGIDLLRLESIKKAVERIRDGFIAHQDGQASNMRRVSDGHLVFNQAPTLEYDDVTFLKKYLYACYEFCEIKIDAI